MKTLDFQMQVVCAFCHISYVKIPFNWFAYKLQVSNCGVRNNWKRVAKQVVFKFIVISGKRKQKELEHS